MKKVDLRFWIKKNWMVVLGGLLFFLFFIFAVAGYFLTFGPNPIFDPYKIRLQQQLLPPLSHADPLVLTKDQIPPFSIYILGTDHLGRDVFSRMLQGAWISLTVGFVSVGISVVIGIIIGSISGFYGDKKVSFMALMILFLVLLSILGIWHRDWVLSLFSFGGIVVLFALGSLNVSFVNFGFSIDSIIMRFVDIMLCFPSFFLILTVVALLPPSIFNIMAVIGLTSWMGTARLVRAEFLSLREQEFVLGAKALGISDFLIIFKHILPNALTPVLVSATIGVATAILTEAGLSFLGFGVPPPQATWGNILSEGKNYLFDAPWLTIIPGIAILIVVLAFNLIGEWIRTALNPRK